MQQLKQRKTYTASLLMWYNSTMLLWLSLAYDISPILKISTYRLWHLVENAYIAMRKIHYNVMRFTETISLDDAEVSDKLSIIGYHAI
jgi:hypothetical protein